VGKGQELAVGGEGKTGPLPRLRNGRSFVPRVGVPEPVLSAAGVMPCPARSAAPPWPARRGRIRCRRWRREGP
jgi:hypothetical protein